MDRQGSCNRCGQCCGANGIQPWPREWYPESGEPSWRSILANNPRYYNFLSFFNVIQMPDGKWRPDPDNLYGNIKITGKTFYFVWIPGVGLVRDSSVAHDGSSWVPECPFLGPDVGGVRACGIASPQYAEWRDAFCEGPLQMTAEEAARWAADHPLCSYTWA